MSNFIVSARKYRPQRFDEVVGQQHVSQTLKNALQTDHLAHAFLFCGPRGVGKTTCARILAKVLNCTNRTADFEACNKCSSCLSFNENASFNITELDAASNNSVEHIRALIEQVRFQPQQGAYKVFIIDEVHMLSNQAFNAFLKTLEEPPPYAIFILATTEKHKIIPTILSRCQIFDFRRIQVQDMVAHLQGICEKEGITADRDALHIIAQKADGALRDALSIFDRLVSSTGKSFTYKDVIENLNVLDYDFYFRFTDALLTEDQAGVLNIFNEVLTKGFDPSIFILGLAEHFRDVLVCKDEQTLSLLEVSDRLQERYRQQAAIAPLSFLLTALQIANQCDVDYRMARNKRLHVEMALLKMTYISRAVKLAQNPLAEAPPLEKKTPEQSIAAAPAAPPSEEKPSIEEAEASPLSSTSNGKPGKRSLGKGILAQLKSEVKTEQRQVEAERPEMTLSLVKDTWKKFTDTVTSAGVKAQLARTELEVVDDRVIKATVGSEMGKSMVQQERGLMEFLRDAFKRKNLELHVHVDPTKNPIPKAKPKKVLTPKEQIQEMTDSNPQVVELIKRFDLQVDRD